MNIKLQRTKLWAIPFLCLLILSGCQKSVFQSPTVAPATLKDVPSVKLNFRFETDVPAPTVTASQPAQSEDRNASIQNDFDQNRPQEVLDKTLASPDKQRVLAVYHKVEDLPAEFRLDMYTADGKLLRKITHDGMAVHFAETILWSPTSTDVAFVAMARVAGGQTAASPSPSPTENAANNATNSETNTNANVSQTPVAATPAAAAQSVFTFRTEQLYVCSADGGELKPLTQNEGLIYFYYVWSPDGASLAAMANTYQEWNFLQAQADAKKEIFIPAGRLRLVEKTGRERRLDDNLTTVRPVWSPDSAKVAGAFETQIQVRIYDAIGDAPTQAAIPLRNPLLLSSKAYDEEAQRKDEQGATGNANTANSNAQTNSNIIQNTNQAANVPINPPIGTLPDASQLVSFNPIINLEWTEDKMLYLQTGYVKLIKNESDSARSFLRWHRLIFSPQATAIK